MYDSILIVVFVILLVLCVFLYRWATTLKVPSKSKKVHYKNHKHS